MISQIPAVTYVVSLGRARQLTTTIGTFSVHHVAPEMFGGFEIDAAGVKLATAEKALFDLFYLSGKRTREFATLPEIELPRGFRWRVMHEWLARVSSPRDRAIVAKRIAAIRN